ncbi:DUF47 domain-containing protein [Brevibacillus daliensis]|uniref:DUF47 domain-containing protein n=1 Tax=Brevibacillus daliensis TaxID=2892995 RepID=UPI001E54E6BA|nr:DUF47 family protein [Brevibacillus daliensis]
MFFKPKDDKLFDKIGQIVLVLGEATNYFSNYVKSDNVTIEVFASTMKDYEHQADTYIHEITTILNKAFITPIEREDIQELAIKLDDVMDGMEELASRMEIYQITERDDFILEFTDILVAASNEIANATSLLFQRNFLAIEPHIIKIKELESQADKVLNNCIRHVFKEQKDPFRLIQYKEIYEMFEDVADNCEGVANALETVIMRNV